MNESVIQKNSNKNKPNKVPYILNRKINTLVNAKRIEDAENHIINLHREYDGKLAIAITSNEDTFRTWNQYSFSIEELLEVVWKFLAEKDVYISANGFWNNRRRLADLRHLKAFVIDLDYYKIEKYAKKTQEEMYSILLKKEKKFFEKVGYPSIVVNSGKGIYMIWLIESAPYMALPLWQLCMNELFKKFEDYGADPKAKDAAHVYRLCGSKNSKNGQVVKFLNNKIEKDIRIYTLEHFRIQLLPNEFEKFLSKKERDNIKKKNGQKRKMTKKELSARQTASIFTTHMLHHKRILDLQKILELRNYEIIKCREKLLFYFRYWNCCFIKDTVRSLEETINLNNLFSEPLELSEVINATASAEEYFTKWEETFNKFCEIELKTGEKMTQRQMNNFFYKEGCHIFTSDKVIDDLNITDVEMREMDTLFNTKEKNRRSKSYRNEWKKNKQKEKLRNEEGRTSREQNKHEKMIIISEMIEAGYKQKDIAEKLGINTSTVSKYKKELETGKYVIENTENQGVLVKFA